MSGEVVFFFAAERSPRTESTDPQISPIYADFAFSESVKSAQSADELLLAKGLKRQVSLRLGVNGIELHLRECAHARKKPTLSWAS